MKKYLQACEIAGSIYGKKQAAQKRRASSIKRQSKEGLMSAYSRFYKNQLTVMDKVFRKK